MKKISLTPFLVLMIFVGSLSGKSLWLRPSTDERGLYSRATASKVGDIVTVTVSESSSFNSSGTEIRNEGGNSNLSTELFRIVNALELDALRVGNDKSGNPVQIDLSKIFGTDYESGEGSISNELSVSSYTITVQVVDRLPNGNLVIEGGRILNLSGEKNFALIRGVIRPIDVSKSNTISSDRIAHASVEIINEGNLSKVQNKGWVTRIIDQLNPF